MSLAATIFLAMTAQAIAGERLHTAVCLGEASAFDKFRKVADEAHQRLADQYNQKWGHPLIPETLPLVSSVQFITSDGVELRGYHLRCCADGRSSAPVVLVAQGNGQRAESLVLAFLPFRDLGFDVFLYDYRGYGLSAG